MDSFSNKFVVRFGLFLNCDWKTAQMAAGFALIYAYSAFTDRPSGLTTPHITCFPESDLGIFQSLVHMVEWLDIGHFTANSN